MVALDIWSAVSLLKSGGLVWAPLVACETEMGAAMHGCLILMPARPATELLSTRPQDN